MRKLTIDVLPGMIIMLAAFFAAAAPMQALGYDERGCTDDEVAFETGHGCWVYHDSGANAGKPVRVWYYYPSSSSRRGSLEVVFAMHGSGRNAAGAIARWQPYADAHGFLLIAPEFSKAHYPTARQYNRGNVRDENGEFRSPADWTFATIEEIFDQVRKAIPEAPLTYSIQGHSAGGQFVHRMALLAPHYRFDTAVAANPGWYLLPDENYRYPCGIENLPHPEVDLAAAYGGKLVVTLGAEDNDPNARWLNHGTCAEMQGTNRYDRGRFFYELARQDALNRGLPFNWRLMEVAGVGHDANGMVHAGADAILDAEPEEEDDEEEEEDEALVLNPARDATVKARYPTSNYGYRTRLQVDGSSLKTTYMAFDLRGVSGVGQAVLTVRVTDPSRGVQHIHEAAHSQWSEAGLTYRNRPGLAGLIATLHGGGRGDVSIDLTDFIRDRTGRIITLVLSSPDRDGLYFESRESESPPQLTLYR
jgi:predicted esterase